MKKLYTAREVEDLIRGGGSPDSIPADAILTPSAKEFADPRAACGWGQISSETAERSLAGSLLDATIRVGDRLVAAGRVIGDGVIGRGGCERGYPRDRAP